MITVTPYFSASEIALLDSTKIPKHIAIVPDGNRRWAKEQTLSKNEGHMMGADTLMDIIRSAKELGIKAVTVYTFSTENWNRDPDEVAALMWLIQTYLIEQCQEMVERGVKLATIGDLAPLDQEVKKTIAEIKERTAHCDKITMILAINYGSRDELKRVVGKIVDDYSEGKVQKEEITEFLIASYLDTNPWGDPTLLIRTSGEMRLSNFLLWQLSYAELYVTDLYWPDFKPCHLLEAILWLQKRNRRIGC